MAKVEHLIEDEATRLTPDELIERIHAEQQRWERKRRQGLMTDADREAERELSRIVHTYLPLADGFDAVLALANGDRATAEGYTNTPVGEQRRRKLVSDPGQ
jgi:hypothetical protein